PAAVVRALDELTEPAGSLRRIETVRIGGRSLEVIHLPAAEMRAGDLPPVTLAVGSEDERAFARSDQQSHSAHVRVPPSTTTSRRVEKRAPPLDCRSECGEFDTVSTNGVRRTRSLPAPARAGRRARLRGRRRSLG